MIIAFILFVLLVAHSNRLQIWIAIDQLVNALLWGWADETLSARSWRMRLKKMRYWYSFIIINYIFFWQKDHCKDAYESEKYKRQLPPQYRE